MNPKKQIWIPTNNSLIKLQHYKYYEQALFIYEQIALHHNQGNDKHINLPKIINKVLSRREIIEALTLLVENGFVYRENYQVGVKPYTYSPVYFNCKISQHYIDTNSTLYKKIRQEESNSKAHLNRIPPHLREMEGKFMNLDFDYDDMFEWIENAVVDVDLVRKKRRRKKKDQRTDKQIIIETKGSWRMSVLALMDRRTRYFNRNKTNNRLSTNLTNLKKELRQFMIGDFIEIDVKNCQPFLLGAILEKIQTEKELEEDVKVINVEQDKNKDKDKNKKVNLYVDQLLTSYSLHPLYLKVLKHFSTIHQKQVYLKNGEGLKSFVSLTKDGGFYEHIATELSLESRDCAKAIMFQILFSENKLYASNKKRFAKLFPEIEHFCFLVKQKKHNALALLLQKLESYIFIDIICDRLFEKGVIPFTVHDSVIVEEAFVDEAYLIVQNSFIDVLGSIPALKTEPLN